MALSKQIITEHGFTCASAYIVITEAAYYKIGNAIARVEIFKDVSARNEEKSPLKMINFAFTYDINSPLNIVAQAYMALKCNEYYSDCSDI